MTNKTNDCITQCQLQIISPCQHLSSLLHWKMCKSDILHAVFNVHWPATCVVTIIQQRKTSRSLHCNFKHAVCVHLMFVQLSDYNFRLYACNEQTAISIWSVWTHIWWSENLNFKMLFLWFSMSIVYSRGISFFSTARHEQCFSQFLPVGPTSQILYNGAIGCFGCFNVILQKVCPYNL